jgi:hypothetical protein
MNSEPLDFVPLWVFFLAVGGFIGGALEIGYRVGRWRRVRNAEEKETPVGTMVASILGLLAFMLAFTFGMAASRFDARRQALLEEANAVGRTYLRARLLPEPHQTEVSKLLKEYVEVRLRGVQEGAIEESIAKSEDLQKRIWSEAVKASKHEKSDSIMTGLFIESLNEMINLHARRVQVGLRSRVPRSIWAGLFTLALLGNGAVGYHAGLSGTRRSPAMLGIVLAFTGVLFLIADLDRPREGFLMVSQQALADVQKTMQDTTP